MGLSEYRRKRDFDVTPEPAGARAAAASAASPLAFVVQKHAATRLHYDFRLEWDGVLLSWAVPKGPSLDPSHKRLAMQTEDHPLEYGGFEGVIPAGEYGAGAVIVWDRGTWLPEGDVRAGLRKGSLKFALSGEKLTGQFALVKIRGRDGRDDAKSWLLIKDRDAYVQRGFDAASLPLSVLSGRGLEQVAGEGAPVWHSDRKSKHKAGGHARVAQPARRAVAAAALEPQRLAGARAAALPGFIAPQLATLVTQAPDGAEWLHEIKLDGYRIQCRVADGVARLATRRDLDWTERLLPLARAAEALPVREALIDGEAAVLLPDGTTSFQALQNALSEDGPPGLVYFAFDLLHLDGYDLREAPLEARKELLRTLLERQPPDGPWRYCEHVSGSGAGFFAEACRLGLEGIVSKRRDARYLSARGPEWVKTKCVREQELVIGGFTAPKGGRTGLGALLVGVHDAQGRLHYAGKVGTGFDAATLRVLGRRLARLRRQSSPFVERPPGASAATWVRPELVAQIAFGEWTSEGRLRHPRFRGLREDKPAGEVVRESPRAASAAPSRRSHTGKVEIAGIALTHPERVLFPEPGTTKRALAELYESIATWMLPHLEGRPLSLVRCPEGAGKPCFYQKHAGRGVPDALRRVKIREATKTGEYLVVDGLPGLISLVQLGVLELHTWNARADRLEEPDRLVFDLDPGPALPWEKVLEAARLIRARLLRLDLVSFVKTTGSKGLHVVVPLQRGSTWREQAEFAEALARGIVAEDATAYTASMSKAARHARIFIDYLRNARGATSVAAYSTRARAQAPISTPLRWDELSPEVRSDHFTLATLPPRLAQLTADPWADYWTTRQALTSARRKAVLAR